MRKLRNSPCTDWFGASEPLTSHRQRVTHRYAHVFCRKSRLNLEIRGVRVPSLPNPQGYPRSIDELEHGASAPNDQQRMVAGMLDRDNLLDLIRTFTLFSTNDKGETIKIVGRYQQFRAVKLAVKRLLEGKTPRERSGIIWHTQGSGKSLTMMFMVREMYHHAQLSQWKVIFVTDRTQLEDQLAETSQSIGFTVKLAERINPENPPKQNSLKELLCTDTADLVMAMIHKFRETDLAETFPELNNSPHILVMTDEDRHDVKESTSYAENTGDEVPKTA